MPGYYKVAEYIGGEWTATTHPDGTVIVRILAADPSGPQLVLRVDFGNRLMTDDPEIPFVLEAGYNMWSMPIEIPGLTARDVLSKFPSTAVSMIMRDASGVYKTYKLSYGSDNNFPVVFGQGYYIKVTEKTRFSLTGVREQSSTVTLQAGYNLVGYDTLKWTTASDLLNHVGPGCIATKVVYLDKDTGQYVTYRLSYGSDGNFVVSPGTAYFIYVAEMIDPSQSYLRFDW